MYVPCTICASLSDKDTRCTLMAYLWICARSTGLWHCTAFCQTYHNQAKCTAFSWGKQHNPRSAVLYKMAHFRNCVKVRAHGEIKSNAYYVAFSSIASDGTGPVMALAQ